MANHAAHRLRTSRNSHRAPRPAWQWAARTLIGNRIAVALAIAAGCAGIAALTTALVPDVRVPPTHVTVPGVVSQVPAMRPTARPIPEHMRNERGGFADQRTRSDQREHP